MLETNKIKGVPQTSNFLNQLEDPPDMCALEWDMSILDGFGDGKDLAVTQPVYIPQMYTMNHNS